MNVIVFISSLAMVYAMPSYIAVPADQIAFVDLTDLRARRVPRQTLRVPEMYEHNYHPIPLQNYQQGTVDLAPPPVPKSIARIQVKPQEEESSPANVGAVSQIAERPELGEYVDFGAHTGDNGAFGWYADYPVRK